MRVGSNLEQSLLGLTRNNIDFDKITIIVYSKGKENLYFIRKALKFYFAKYLSFIPETQESIFEISDNQYNKFLKCYHPKMHSYLFRDALNSAWEGAGMSADVRAITLN